MSDATPIEAPHLGGSPSAGRLDLSKLPAKKRRLIEARLAKLSRPTTPDRERP